MSADSKDKTRFRISTVILAGTAGLVFGIILVFIAAWAFDCELPAQRVIFGGGFAAAVIGAVYPDAALGFVEGMIHLIFGMASESMDHHDHRQELGHDVNTPRYLQAALLLGGLIAALFYW